MYQFKPVENEQEFLELKKRWEEACEAKNFESDPFKENADLYIVIHTASKRVVGTVALTPYEAETSDMEYYQPFHQLTEVQQHPSRVYEVDKVCLEEKHQKTQAMKQIFLAIIHHGFTRKAKYYISVTESIFHGMLEKKFNIQTVGDPMEYEGFTLHGSLLDFEKALASPFGSRCAAQLQKETIK